MWNNKVYNTILIALASILFLETGFVTLKSNDSVKQLKLKYPCSVKKKVLDFTLSLFIN